MLSCIRLISKGQLLLCTKLFSSGQQFLGGNFSGDVQLLLLRCVWIRAQSKSGLFSRNWDMPVRKISWQHCCSRIRWLRCAGRISSRRYNRGSGGMVDGMSTIRPGSPRQASCRSRIHSSTDTPDRPFGFRISVSVRREAQGHFLLFSREVAWHREQSTST